MIRFLHNGGGGGEGVHKSFNMIEPIVHGVAHRNKPCGSYCENFFPECTDFSLFTEFKNTSTS